MKDARFVDDHTDSLRREAARLARLVEHIGGTPTEGDLVLLMTAIEEAARKAHFSAAALNRYHADALARVARGRYN